MSESDSDDLTPEAVEDDSVTADADVAPADPAAAESPADQSQAGPTVSTSRWIAATLGLLLLASAGLAGWLYFGVLRADQQLGPAAEQAVMAAAADGAVAVLTYAPKTMEQDFAAAESHLTGDFLSHYTDFTQKVVTPAVKEKEVQTIAAVVRKGIVSLRPGSAEVLIYLNQTTISKTNPDGSYSMSSVKVGLEKHGGRWLISSFDPV
ncbi:twin-arginine translocation pathway signal [Mycolicibacter senuensis]|uniref:twin-arginine translocation pathway signal n=1 Tax=Mycolicibacter senuensis TaxID=386913 RepID=UPI000DCDA4AF|nr:twin-arginine translocation pathway signal [Mycolicibacter senuensis]RAV02250.1 twin-arginine translocation pathway signal [Mycolicibacter senuensis]